MAAAREGRAQVVADLIEADATLGIQDTNGDTALDIAEDWGHEEAAALLAEAMAARAP